MKMMENDFTTILAIEKYLEENCINIKGENYLKDIDAANMYDIDIKILHHYVSKNPKRFPSDFMIKLPDNSFAFTYAGLMMLGGLAKTKRAIKANIQLIEFVVKNMKSATGMSVFELLAKEIK